jgi:hypothetical protein
VVAELMLLVAISASSCRVKGGAVARHLVIPTIARRGSPVCLAGGQPCFLLAVTRRLQATLVGDARWR